MKNINYKSGLTLVWISFMILCLIFYKYQVQSTIENYMHYSDLKKRVESTVNLSEKIIQLKQDINRLDSHYADTSSQSQDINEIILQKVSEYSLQNDLILRYYPSIQSQKNKDLELVTTHFIVEGRFSKILDLLFELEYKTKICRIISVKYYTVTDPKMQRKQLYASVFVQNIIKSIT